MAQVRGELRRLDAGNAMMRKAQAVVEAKGQGRKRGTKECYPWHLDCLGNIRCQMTGRMVELEP